MARGIRFRGDGNSDRWLADFCSPSGKNDLPLIHVTQAGAARNIIRQGRIHVTQCRVFSGEKLVYFFVMRPDYKHRSDSIEDTQIDHFPAAFIMSSALMPLPHRIVPFDSGAANNGLFDRAFSMGASRHIALEDYMLLPDIRSVSTFIDQAFGGTEPYFRGNIKAELVAHATTYNQGIQSYIAIAGVAAVGKNEPDRRSNAIEVSFNQSISLESNIRAIVLPDRFMEKIGIPNEEMRNACALLGVVPIYYDWQPGVTPESRRHLLNLMVENYLRENDYFKS